MSNYSREIPLPPIMESVSFGEIVNRLKQLDGFEISFNKLIDQRVLVEWTRLYFGLEENEVWNWSRKEEEEAAGNKMRIDIRFLTEEDPGKEFTMVTMLMNQVQTVPDLFELDAGMELATLFNCAVIVSEPPDSDYFLQVFPGGIVNRCMEGKNADGKTVYDCVVKAGLQYETLIVVDQRKVEGDALSVRTQKSKMECAAACCPVRD